MLIKDKTYDGERALYNLNDIELDNVRFTGEADGESAIKECKNVIVKNSYFDLRYALWCGENILCDNIELTENARSCIWYSKKVKVTNSILHGVKLFRMCNQVEVNNCDIDSIEFAWNAKNMNISNVKMKSVYPFLRASNITLKDSTLNTNYPFQQAKDCVIENVTIEAKDAFWDSENITIKNSTLIGDFLAWHSKNITLINCRIVSSQPLCYIENLKVIDCDMEGCDLAFEYSNVNGNVLNIESIKNPCGGVLDVSNVSEVILEGGAYKKYGVVNILKK